MTELEKYREIYNSFICLLAELHNLNVSFSRQPSDRNGFALRRVLRELKVVEKTLWNASKASSKEAIVNNAARLQAKREERAYRKLHPKKKGRKPKENQNDNHRTTTTTIR